MFSFQGHDANNTDRHGVVLVANKKQGIEAFQRFEADLIARNIVLSVVLLEDLVEAEVHEFSFAPGEHTLADARACAIQMAIDAPRGDDSGHLRTFKDRAVKPTGFKILKRVVS